ncbi:MAG: alpha/beta hydrolase [Burkholderiales bacterium]|nr:alpha/beta hydrolase [Burkholderiales bacterium]
MREDFVRCFDPHGFHFMRYVEWGDPHNKHVLICVHGLTRNARDFDHVAQSLEDAYRVISVDIVGRGRSDWLRDPADYNYPVYCSDLTTLIAKLGVESVDWLGTSMGGIIGMIMASLPGSPVRKLVINDVGAMLPKAALERIGLYVGRETVFDSIEAMEAALRSVSPFGELTDEQWRHLTVTGARQDDHGKWRFRYDPGIAKNFHAVPPADIDLRPIWNGVHGPALVIRGEHSDLLRADTLEEMSRRAHTQTLIVPRTGHAPMLMDDFQAGAIRRFLLGSEPFSAEKGDRTV